MVNSNFNWRIFIFALSALAGWFKYRATWTCSQHRRSRSCLGARGPPRWWGTRWGRWDRACPPRSWSSRRPAEGPQYWDNVRTGQWVLMMMMSKLNIQVYPFRKVGFMIKCTSQGTESLYGWLYIIKLNRPFFRRVKGMNLRVRRSEQKTVVCWERPLAFSENIKPQAVMK